MQTDCPHCGQNINLGDEPPSGLSCPACGGRIEIKIHAKAKPVPVTPATDRAASPVLPPASREGGVLEKSDENFVIQVRSDRWTVNFGSTSGKRGSLGFRLTGQAFVADGKLLLNGWRLWPASGRIVVAALLAVVLWFPLKEAGWWLAEQMGMLAASGRGYLRSVQREHNQLMGYFLIMPVAAMISGFATWWVATRWMIHKQSARFVPLSRPTVRTASATLQVDSEDGGLPKTCTLRFQSTQDAQSFANRFVG